MASSSPYLALKEWERVSSITKLTSALTPHAANLLKYVSEEGNCHYSMGIKLSFSTAASTATMEIVRETTFS